MFYLFIFGYLIFAYVMQSLSLYTLARRRGIANPALAWVPIGNFWIIGSIARDYDRQNNIDRRWDKTLFGLSIAYIASIVLIYIGMFTTIMTMAIQSNGAEISDEMAAQLFLTIFALLIPIAMVATAMQIISYICFYKIFESTVPSTALKYFLISLLVPFAQPICLFLCRNKGYEHPDPLAYLYAPVNKPTPPWVLAQQNQAAETVETENQTEE